MKRFLWPVLFTAAPLVSGCGTTVTAPAPPVDLAAPAAVETATFALG
jgi:hypothetical protein